MANSNTLKRHEIRRIFRRHHGAQAKIVRELSVASPTVSLWLQGHVTSKRIAEAAQRLALDLLRTEEEAA